MNNDGHGKSNLLDFLKKKNSLVIDTNASYAGQWLANFHKTTLSNKKLLEKTVILISFDEVILKEIVFKPFVFLYLYRRELSLFETEFGLFYWAQYPRS